MAISGDYTVPVTVNGFNCRNCTDVGYAAKLIDPAHPKSGPNNVDAARDPSQPAAVRVKLADAKAAAEGARRDSVGYSPRGIAAAAIPAGLVIDLHA